MAVLRLTGMIKEYRFSKSLNVIIGNILNKGPVVVSSRWTTQMSNAKEKMNIGGTHRGFHAYCINGVNRDRAYFRVQNSWGKSWGVKGRSKLSFAAMQQLLEDPNTYVCLPVEQEPKKKMLEWS